MTIDIKPLLDDYRASQEYLDMEKLREETINWAIMIWLSVSLGVIIGLILIK